MSPHHGVSGFADVRNLNSPRRRPNWLAAASGVALAPIALSFALNNGDDGLGDGSFRDAAVTSPLVNAFRDNVQVAVENDVGFGEVR